MVVCWIIKSAAPTLRETNGRAVSMSSDVDNFVATAIAVEPLAGHSSSYRAAGSCTHGAATHGQAGNEDRVR